MTTSDRLFALIREEFGKDPAAYPEPLNLNLVRDMGADSLDMVELAMHIEDEFHIDLSDAEMEPFVADDGKAAPHALSELVALIDGKVVGRVEA